MKKYPLNKQDEEKLKAIKEKMKEAEELIDKIPDMRYVPWLWEIRMSKKLLKTAFETARCAILRQAVARERK
jgi:hypothetical protein